MSRPSYALLLSVLMAFSANAAPMQTGGEPAWPNPKAAADLGLRDVAYPKASVAKTVFAPIDAARIDAMRIDNSVASAKLLMIGVERDVAAEAASRQTSLDWRMQPDGRRVAQMQVTSPGAVAMRAALDVAELPAGTELRFTGDLAPRESVAVVGADEIAKLREVQPLYWTPVTEGQTQTIEIALPAGTDPQWARLSLKAASHLFVSPSGTLAGAKIGESDDCEFDAKCLTNPSAAYNSAKNAVARMAFQTGEGTGLCTGTLLNDTDPNTQVPNFYSAAHCFTSQSVASTLTTFWFYEATSCGSGVLDSGQRQISGGATVLFANTSSDVLLVRLNNAPPTGAYYLGWNSAALSAGTEIAVLHHPAGDVKKVSIGGIKGFGTSNLASGNFIKVGYTDGTTEGGSSGCGLLTLNANGDFQLRGGLLGGTAGCANTGSLATPANSDDFSRFDQVFPSLQSFLQPAATPAADYTGAWSDPSQSGWGVAVIRGASGTYAMNLYHYDQANTSAWYLGVGPLNGTSFSQSVTSFSGPWFGIVPFNSAAVAGRNAGTLTINFTSATTANLSFTIDGRTVTASIRKLAF
jgi:lysyl endopeptidase